MSIRPRFSLRVLLLFFAAVAVFMGMTSQRARERMRVQGEFAEMQNRVDNQRISVNIGTLEASPHWFWNLYGETAASEILYLSFSHVLEKDEPEVARLIARCQELEVICFNETHYSRHWDWFPCDDDTEARRFETLTTPAYRNYWRGGDYGFQGTLGDSTMAAVCQLPKIKELSVLNTNVSDRGLQDIGNLQDLELLDLSFSNVTKTGLQRLTANVKLQELYLAGTLINDDALRIIADMKNIEKLNLSYTPITSAGMAHLCRLPRLRSLCLFATYVDDAGLDMLSQCPALVELTVNYTKTTDVGRERFQMAKPNCKLVK